MKKVVVVIMTLSLLAASALADPGMRAPRAKHHGCEGTFGDGTRMGGPGMLLRMADEIGLTDDQKDQISRQAETFANQRIDKEAELEKAEVKLRTLRFNEAPEKEVLAAMDMVGVLRTELAKMRYVHRQRVHDILTEEQLDKIKELGPKFGQGSRGGRGPGNNRSNAGGRHHGFGDGR